MAQLTPEQLAAQRAGLLNPDGTLNIEAVMRHSNAGSWAGGGRGGFAANPIYAEDWSGGSDGYGAEGGAARAAPPVTGWRIADKDLGNVESTDRSQWNGVGYKEFDAQGRPTGAGTYQGLMDSEHMGMTLAKYAAILAGGAVAGGALSSYGIGGIGGAGGGLSEMGLAGEGAFGTTNALGGAGAFGPQGAAYYGLGGSGALGGGLGAAEAGGGALGGGPGSAGWGMDLGGAGLADTSYVANVGGSGGLLGGGGASSALPSLAEAAGGAGSWLGKAATLAGGLLGAKGVSNDQTKETKLDPRLDAAYYGQGGIVPLTQGLLTQSMSPEGQAPALEQIRRGQGLLTGPIAGNGFNRFYPGR